MDKKLMKYELRSTEAFLLHVASVFDEGEAQYAPQEGVMTVAQQLAHAAQTVDWFLEGATRPEGFDLDFEEHFRAIQQISTLDEARAWVRRSFAAALAYLVDFPDEALNTPLPEGPVMAGMPRKAIFMSIIDHTAHHRGALAMYARALGKTPPMPYEVQLDWD